jgi:predicted dehydrogenase
MMATIMCGGWSHLSELACPFFVDKPLATNIQDLGRFVAWRQEGKIIMSSSGLRYSPEVAVLRGKSWRWLTGVTCKTWERYGIHVLEPIATVVGPGFERVRATRRTGSFHAEIEHRSGTVISLTAIAEGYGSAFVLHGYDDHGHSAVEMRDTYSAFRAQLVGFLTAVAGLGPEPVAFAETVELMATVIAARESADNGGRAIDVRTVLQRLPA